MNKTSASDLFAYLKNADIRTENWRGLLPGVITLRSGMRPDENLKLLEPSPGPAPCVVSRARRLREIALVSFR